MSYKGKLEELKDFPITADNIDSLVKKSGKYLVFLDKGNWAGASGCKIVDDIESTVYRGYDCTIRAIETYSSGKLLSCIEYHHDVPQGHKSYILALSKQELRDLEKARYSGKMLPTARSIINSYLLRW